MNPIPQMYKFEQHQVKVCETIEEAMVAYKNCRLAYRDADLGPFGAWFDKVLIFATPTFAAPVGQYGVLPWTDPREVLAEQFLQASKNGTLESLSTRSEWCPAIARYDRRDQFYGYLNSYRVRPGAETEATKPTEEWGPEIAWNGSGLCPIPKAKTGEYVVRFRDGTWHWSREYANDYRWTHLSSSKDIVAYCTLNDYGKKMLERAEKPSSDPAVKRVRRVSPAILNEPMLKRDQKIDFSIRPRLRWQRANENATVAKLRRESTPHNPVNNLSVIADFSHRPNNWKD